MPTEWERQQSQINRAAAQMSGESAIKALFNPELIEQAIRCSDPIHEGYEAALRALLRYVSEAQATIDGLVNMIEEPEKKGFVQRSDGSWYYIGVQDITDQTGF